MGRETPVNPLSKYGNYQDLARLEYGRLLWRNPSARRRLLRNWSSPDHPHAARFAENRELVEHVLSSSSDYTLLDRDLRARGQSLRTAAREIPPVFRGI